MANPGRFGRALGWLLRTANGATPLRDPAKFQAMGDAQPFGPGAPMQSQQPAGTPPRSWLFPPSINVGLTPRALPGLSAFQELRNFAASYDVLRICIETRKQQMRGLKWDVVVRDPRLDHPDFDHDIQAAVAFLSHPDGRNPFSAWIGAALEDVLVIDALSIFKRRDRAGRLLALELIDGATVKPLVDEYGRPPSPPDSAYQQFAYGFAWAQFSAKEIMYRPFNPRTFVNYGLSPVEQIIVTVTIALSRQITAINHYKEGNAPAGFGEVPKEWSSEMIRQFEEMFNGLLAGDFAARSRIKMVPSGFSFKPWIDSGTTFNPTYDEYLARVVCGAFGVAPTQFIRSFNRATAEVADDAATVAGFDPLKEFIERLMDEILVAPDGLNMPHLRFTFTTEKRRDEELELKKNIEYLKAGVLSVDDVLVRLGMEPLGFGRFVAVPGQGLVPLAQIFPSGNRSEQRADLASSSAVALSDAERAELGKWLKKARRVLSSGTSAPEAIDFQSETISTIRHDRILKGLRQATTSRDAEAIFRNELETGVAPQSSLADALQILPAVQKVISKIRNAVSGLALERSGLYRDGFRKQVQISWLHDRLPDDRDRKRDASEYFDDTDLELSELAEVLGDALTHSHAGAGIPLPPEALSGVPRPTRLGARASFSDSQEWWSASASGAVDDFARTLRSRLNQAIDFAHSHALTRSEFRDAMSRATDFSDDSALRMIRQAIEQLKVSLSAESNADL